MQHPALALTWPCCSGLAALSMLFGRHASSTTAQHEGAQKSGHTEHGQHAVRGRSRVCSARACHGLHAVRNAGHGQRFATPGHCALAGVGRQDACPTRPWHCLHTLTDAAAAALAACACSCAAAQTGWHVHRNAAAKAGHCPASQGCAGSGELRARFQGIGQPQRHSWSNRPSTAAPSSSITSAASMERPRRWNAAAAAVRAVRQPPYDASTGGGRPAGNSRTCRPARRPPTFTHIPAASEFCSVRLRMRRASRTRNYICAADLHTYTRAGLLGLLQHQGADVGGSGEGGCAPAWPPSAYRNSPPTTGTPRRSQT